MQFTYLGEKEGLSNEVAMAITQDNDGFMWFGTLDGLNRFDGYRIRKFYQVPGRENSLVNNYISCLSPGRGAELWISTNQGVSCYNERTGQFRNFRHIPDDSNSLATDEALNICPGDNGCTWLQSPAALYQVDSLLNCHRIDIGFQKILDDRREILSYKKMIEDSSHRLWACADNRLYLLDRHTMKIQWEYGPAPGFITTIYEDADRQFWIGTYGSGLARFDPQNGQFTPVPLEGGAAHVNYSVVAASAIINSITEWRDHNNKRWLVLGTYDGIVLVDPVSGKNREYGFGPRNLQNRSLPSNVIHCVYTDRQNILWIATARGICYVEPFRQQFELWDIYTPQEMVTNTFMDVIFSASQNSGGSWMSRWGSGGLLNFNPEGHLIREVTTVYDHHAPKELRRELKPLGVLCQGDSIVWFTCTNDLVRFRPLSGQATLYPVPDLSEFGPNSGLRDIAVLDNRHWWIRTRSDGRNGIYVFDPVARKFIRHYSHTKGVAGSVPPELNAVLVTADKRIFLASKTQGLYRYDPPSDEFLPVLEFRGKDMLQHSNDLTALAEDRRGVLWIGSTTGLIAFDPVAGKIVRDYCGGPPFGGVAISKVFIDQAQNIWLNTQRGIFSIDPSGRIGQLSSVQGLPNNYTDGILQSANDHFIYSGIMGFLVRIQPSGLITYHHGAAAVHFSEATIMDTPVIIGFGAAGTRELVLSPGQDRFTVDFSVMNYENAGNNRYYYRLAGVMDNWQQNDNGHLSFYGLGPGRYRLEVKGSSEWADDIAGTDFINVVIRPHWWQTDWFFVCCVLLAIGILVVVVRRQIGGIRKEAAIKQQQAAVKQEQAAMRQRVAETEMQALRAQMNPHFIFNSLNSIENFMMKNEKESASDYFGKFATLIRMILESSRNERVTFARDMEALQLYVELEQLRFNHGFSYVTRIDPVLLDEDCYVPPLLIQPYVENAILHGLSQSEKTGLQLTVTACVKGDFLVYTIEDNGVGRQQAELFKQHKPPHGSMGLRITQERINILNQQDHAGAAVRIIDLYDDGGAAAGTKVELTIKTY
jgi:ligand-binding sensor domain-containing protein